MAERNCEDRTIPGVPPEITVSRDGDVKVNGVIDYSCTIVATDGTRMSVQMAIHLAFPDIPLRWGRPPL